VHFICNGVLVAINTPERAGFFGYKDGDGVVLFHAAKESNILHIASSVPLCALRVFVLNKKTIFAPNSSPL